MRVLISMVLGMCSVFGVLLISPEVSGDQKNDKFDKKNDGPDWGNVEQARKRQILAQLRGQFETYDRNDDKALDREELAKALRGPNAKVLEPSEDADTKTKNADRTAEAIFIAKHDKDGDGIVQKKEFDTFAEAAATIQARQIVEVEKTEHRLRELQMQALKEKVQAQKQHYENLLKIERERLERLRRMNDKDKKNDKDDKNDKKKDWK